MAEHRWQGYSHEELYQSIHAGPGPSASHTSIERWAGVSAALTEINADLHAGITGSGARWEGAAADTARAGLNPLAAWADDARSGSEVMRISAELQADHISKARADMPPPVQVTAEQPNSLVTGLTHLFGGQTDHEKQEAAANAAEARAREVMTTYASSTVANTSTLGQFHQPPQLVINASGPARADGPGVAGPVPMFGVGPQGGGAAATSRRGVTRGAPVVPPARTAGTSGGASATRTSGVAHAPGAVASGTTSVSSAGAAAGGTGTAGVAVPGQQQRKGKQESQAPDATTSSSSAAAAPAIQAAVAQHTSSLGAATGTIGAAAAGAGAADTVHKRSVAASGPTFDPFGAMGARGADEEEDAVHQAADYLRETDDIYGVGTYSLPVIGESTTD